MKVTPEALTAAASDLTNINTTLTEATEAAAAHTTTITAAGADEVSEAVTALFNTHGQQFQHIAAQAQTFHQQFAHNMTTTAAAYHDTEAANTHPLGEALNIFSIYQNRHEFRLGLGPYIYTAMWNWNKIY